MHLTPEAERYRHEVDRRRAAVLQAVSNLPIAVLIWGPAPTAGTPAASARNHLKEELLRTGHLAHFSEELVDPASPFSLELQQLSHVEAYDIIFSIPDSPGSIAEIHDFAKVPRLAHKIVAFLNQNWNNGYSNRTLIELQSRVTCAVELYDPANLPTCVISKALELVRRLQEVYYFLGRRP
jgi:hypothetical protein